MNTTIQDAPGAKYSRLHEEATFARERFQRYKARRHGPGVTNLALLFELESAFVVTESRVRHANPAAEASRVPRAVVRN